MRIGIFLALALSVCMFSNSARANYDSYYDMVLCDSCVNEQSFKDSGSSTAGNGYNGERLILVINTNTRQYRNVLVTNTPPGQIPLGGPGQQTQAAGPQTESERPAEIIRLPGNLRLDELSNFAPTLIDSGKRSEIPDRQPTTQGAGSRITQSSNVDPVFSAQIGEILDLADDSWVILMPADYPSYLGSEHVLVSTQIYNALTNRFGTTWGVEKASKSVWVRLLQMLKLNKGKNAQVCAIFVNGDSACYQVYPTSPSSADLVDGSQKDVNGNPLPAASTGSGSGSGLGVSSGGGRVSYSGSNPGTGGGSWVYVTISCVRGGDGRLSSCTIQYETRAN